MHSAGPFTSSRSEQGDIIEGEFSEAKDIKASLVDDKHDPR